MTVGTYTWMSAPDISSDVAFRKWAQGIHDGLIAAGLVATTDTGQVTISTMTVPTTANTAAGYRVYKFNDAAQSTCPIFIKIEFGRANSTANAAPAFWLTVGQGTDGAGTITGTLLARTQNYSSTTQGTSTEYASYASGDGTCFAVGMWASYTVTHSFFFAIDRSRDASGNATADAVLIVFGCYSNQSVSVIGNGGTPGSVKSVTGALLPVLLPNSVNGVAASVSSTLSKDGVTAPVFPIACCAPGVAPWVSNLLVAVHPGDAGATSVITAATVNGATRIYRAWPTLNTASGTVGIAPAAPASAGALSNPSRCWPAILWAV